MYITNSAFLFLLYQSVVPIKTAQVFHRYKLVRIYAVSHNTQTRSSNLFDHPCHMYYMKHVRLKYHELINKDACLDLLFECFDQPEAFFKLTIEKWKVGNAKAKTETFTV